MVKRDKSHEEQIERWANFVREHPDEWKAKVKPLIDSQILMAKRFYNKLAETSEGRQKILELKARKS